MVAKLTAAEMAQALKAFKPHSAHLEMLDAKNIVLQMPDFLNGEPLRLRLNLESAVFTPEDTRSELAEEAKTARIKYYVTLGQLAVSEDGQLLIAYPDTDRDDEYFFADERVQFAEQLIFMLGVWYSNPNFRQTPVVQFPG